MKAWYLNLDAEMELAEPVGYTPSVAVREHVARALPSARKSVMGEADVLVREGERLPAELRGIEGHAWCMTPRAVDVLVSAGACPVESPPLEVLRRVNDRRFCAALGVDLPGAGFADCVEDVEAAFETGSVGEGWLLKRAFAVAGRGQRRVRAPLTEADRTWLAASFRTGGVAVEPRVAIALETSVHGVVERDGTLEVRVPGVQLVDARGAWKATRAAQPGELTPDDGAALVRAARATAEALRDAGYFGPFGVDGFVYTDAAGRRRLNARSEINARYTMGF